MYGGLNHLNIFEPQVVITHFSQNISFIAIGTHAKLESSFSCNHSLFK
ncbi:hypothetical protein HOF65_08475 [bacterium]|nr:hypothetical protein [bacterium]MBT3853914.1 hypothetical protein [bacterium]